MPSDPERPCRIVILGATQLRLQRVVALLHEVDHRRDTREGEIDDTIAVDYLPCVAKFDSYLNDQGVETRYLVSVDYHGPDASSKTPGNLLPYFDQEEGGDDKDDADKPLFGPIAGVVVCCGIEGDEYVALIDRYFQTFSTKQRILIECVRPNEEFSSMKQETDYFRSLDADGREQATRQRMMGPGKEAKFISDFAERIISEALRNQTKKQDATVQPPQPEVVDDSVHEHSLIPMSSVPGDIDPSKNRYSCRKCRLPLFGEDDLQDPPHVPSVHAFSHRKLAHSSNSTASTRPCQSYFLASGLDWMGDMTGAEGRFACPKCHTKLGSWNWSGSQCSCGTWVTPAIQVPSSKVDTVLPSAQRELPAGTVISPVVQLQREDNA